MRGSVSLTGRPTSRAAIAAFLEEVAPLVESGRWLPGPGVGVSADDLAGLPVPLLVTLGNHDTGEKGIDPKTGQIVAGGIAAETRQTMESIKATLIANGSSLDRVVKCTVMLADIGEWAAMNEVYAQYFPNHRPARSSFGASGLALNARVEIECIAVIGAPS